MEIKLEKLIETIVEEVLTELKEKNIRIDTTNEEKKTCGCVEVKVNPCCKTSSLSEKYLKSLTKEASSIMAL